MFPRFLDFPGKNTGLSCHFLLQGILQTQGSKPGLLHWHADSLPLSLQGRPWRHRGIGKRDGSSQQQRVAHNNQHPKNWLTGSCQQDASPEDTQLRHATHPIYSQHPHSPADGAREFPNNLVHRDVSSWPEPPNSEKVRNFEHFKALPWGK